MKALRQFTFSLAVLTSGVVLGSAGVPQWLVGTLVGCSVAFGMILQLESITEGDE